MGDTISRQGLPPNLYNNTRMCALLRGANKRDCLRLFALTSRVVWHYTDEGWSSDFPPLPSAFSRILNGVYA